MIRKPMKISMFLLQMWFSFCFILASKQVNFLCEIEKSEFLDQHSVQPKARYVR